MSILSPKDIFELGGIKAVSEQFPIDLSLQLQQNGFDLRINRIFRVEGNAIFTLNKANEVKPKFVEVLPNTLGMFQLKPNTQYNVEFMEDIDVPEFASALVIHRSSFNRTTCSVWSGWFDSGFKSSGGCGAVIRTDQLTIHIERGYRLAQVIFFEADAASQYNGQYQNKSVDLK